MFAVRVIHGPWRAGRRARCKAAVLIDLDDPAELSRGAAGDRPPIPDDHGLPSIHMVHQDEDDYRCGGGRRRQLHRPSWRLRKRSFHRSAFRLARARRTLHRGKLNWTPFVGPRVVEFKGVISPAVVLQESSRFLLVLLWVCGQRVCVVQAKRHIHKALAAASILSMPARHTAIGIWLFIAW